MQQRRECGRPSATAKVRRIRASGSPDGSAADQDPVPDRASPKADVPASRMLQTFGWLSDDEPKRLAVNAEEAVNHRDVRRGNGASVS